MEFLPLCDVLFNVISLAEYFCHILFDFVFFYAVFDRQDKTFSLVILFILLSSLVVSQIVSLKWYLDSNPTPEDNLAVVPASSQDPENTPKMQTMCLKHSRKGRYVVFILHTFQLGILWRYTKLFVPFTKLRLRQVKHDVRELCMLRLLHAFCESAPMLLLQLHVLISMRLDEARNASSSELRLKIIGQSVAGPIVPSGPHSYPTSAILLQQNRTFKDLNTIAATLSLFSVCWALASFSKNVRLANVQKLVLTWLGVIFQFFWRLGTVISRVTALTVYASLYHHWIFLVLVLHWVSMLLWLISPKNVFHGEKISRMKKATLSAMIAFVYVFAYINLQEVNHRQKMVTFYIVMFLENLLLVCLWMVGIWPDRGDKWWLPPVTVIASFAIGILFMITYYRYFHVRRLGFESGGRPEVEEYQSKNKTSGGTTSYHGGKSRATYNSPAVAGVFNCRFTNPVNGATKRKKKKPTSFVPPANLKIPLTTPTSLPHPQFPQAAQPQHLMSLQNQIHFQSRASPRTVAHYPQAESSSGGPMAIPFWKQPLVTSSQNGSSENESSVGSRVNIQQKLQEKKQKQLAELKVIEEEIKQGKLVGPQLTGTLSSNEGSARQQSLPRQPIPRIKKHDLDPTKFYDNGGGYSNMMMLQSCYDDTSDVDVYGTAYVVDHHHRPSSSSFNQTNNLNMPPTDVNSLTRAVISKSKVPRTFHQNIQASTATPSPTIPPGGSQHPPTDTNTTNSNKSSSTQSQSRGPIHMNPNSSTYKHVVRNAAGVISPNVQDGVQFVVGYSSKMASNRGTPPVQSAQINSPMMHMLHRQQQIITPVLLSPHPYLEHHRGPQEQGEFYNWNQGGGSLSSEEEEDNTHHPPSDIDSQMSLPRSYTLPREFKYYRRSKSRKMDNFVANNNSSSDGDVDSVDDNESNAGGHAPKHYYNNMTRRQYAQQQATGRISVPAVGNQPIYLNSPPPHSYVRNLDLISNVLDGTQQQHALSAQHHLPHGVRRMRYPGFRTGGTGPNVETKL